MGRVTVIAAGQGESATDVPIADGEGGYAWGAVSGGSGGSGFPTNTTDRVIYVSKNGNDSTGNGLAWATAYLTIGKALSTLSSSQTATIYVGAGTYAEEVWIDTCPVTLIGMGVPGAATHTAGTTIAAPSDARNCINIIGGNPHSVDGTAIRDICTQNFSASSTGVGIRGVGASTVKVTNWVHDNQGWTPVRGLGGIGIEIGHGESWEVNGYAIAYAAQGIVLGIEAQEHKFTSGRQTGNYQDRFGGNHECYRSQLTSSVTNSQSTFPIYNTVELLSSGVAFTKDLLAAPSAPTLAASGSGGTLTAGTYTVAVTYVNQFGETVGSSTSTQAVTSGQDLVITSPSAYSNATGWYAYVSQVGGSSVYRQQTAGSPTAIGTNLTLSANPTTSGAWPLSLGTAFIPEGVAYAGNTGNSLTGLSRAVVGCLNVSINNSQTTGITIAGLSQGNTSANGNVVTQPPSSGAVQIGSEQISYTSLTNNANGTWTLAGTVTRGANSTTAASHTAATFAQDVALASAAAHASGVQVIQSYGTSGLAGALPGSSTFDTYKAVSCQSQNPGDYVEEWWGGQFLRQNDLDEGNTNTVKIHSTVVGMNWDECSFAPETTVSDDSTQSVYSSPVGGNVVLTSLSSEVVVENNLGTTFTDSGTGNRYGAVRVDSSSATAPTVDHSTALVDQAGWFFDQASGKVKGATLLAPPTPLTTGDLWYVNSSGTLSRLAVGSSGQFVGQSGGLPAWATPAGFANPMTTADDLIVGGASGAPGRLAIGSNGNVLTVVSGAPAWASPSSSAVTRQQTLLTALGIISEPYRLAGVTGTGAITSQQITCALIGLLSADVVTNIVVCLSTAGVGTAPTLIRLGLATTSGTILAVTADVHASSAFTSTGFAVIPLTSPYTVTSTAGYYACILENGAFGTTPMALYGTATAAAQVAFSLSSNPTPYASQNSQSDLPGVSSSMTLGGGATHLPWIGVS